MCLCIFALNQHDEYPFVLLANRDEFRNRPSAKADFWADSPQVLAGRDLQQMGTWLGITDTGRLAFLTNYRQPSSFRPDAPSRGALTSDFLLSDADAPNYLKALKRPESYNGFNLVVGRPDSLFYYSNVQQRVQPVSEGVHGLSNAMLDTPWPKVDDGKAQLADLLKKNHWTTDDLFDILADAKCPADSLLPDTGVGIQLERLLSSRFINTPDYGTVCSTVITIDRHRQCRFQERSFDAHGLESGRTEYRLRF